VVIYSYYVYIHKYIHINIQKIIFIKDVQFLIKLNCRLKGRHL
ncbi:hypothetical protein HMPREF3195_01134, partial [Peptostreptococcus anaerobius]